MDDLAPVSNELPLLGCRGSRYRVIARNNWPKGSGAEVQNGWFPSVDEAITAFDKGPNRWMRWSFALLIERCDGVRTWAPSFSES